MTVKRDTALFCVRGVVAHGKHIGSTIGYPTANLPLPATGDAPENGVYIASLTVADGATYYGVCNQGLHPTYPDGAPSVEVFLMTGRPELYDCEVEVRYLRFLRAERRFTDGAALAEQIALDVARAKEWLGGRGVSVD